MGMHPNQIIRVVDSSNNEYVVDAITPSTNIRELSNTQFEKQTVLGELMAYLGVKQLDELSHMIRLNSRHEAISPTWIQVYRELIEWAVLFSIIRTKEFGTDTLIVFDGLLRSKIFSKDLFKKYLQGIKDAISRHYNTQKRKIYLVGLAKHSKVLTRYRLTMVLEQILTTDYPAYVEIPREIEEKAYIRSEYARGDDVEEKGKEVNRFVGGKMFFVKFGSESRDPIWPVDIFTAQRSEAQMIIGSLLADALEGFPTPFYPRCLQKAHYNAALTGIDFEILQKYIFDGIRNILGSNSHILDITRIQEQDPAQRRYDNKG